MNCEKLEERARYVRLNVLEAINRSGRGHIGGSFSCVEILVALYYHYLNISPESAESATRDRFVMGKGHACLSLYPILLDQGYITEERYLEYGLDGGSLGGQLDRSVPTVDNNTGSLGHALGLCAGMAFAAKLDASKAMSVALIGDAECDEGSVWESIWFAGEHQLNQLVCVIDRNRLSVTDVIESSCIFDDFEEKITAFGWHCIEIDGHSMSEVVEALDKTRTSTKPTMILANTVKGKGVSFMENDVKWHHAVPSEEEIERARAELGGAA